MINFIIYEDEQEFCDLYTDVILKFMGGNDNSYKITIINKYDKETPKTLANLKGKKIFLLDVKVPGKSGLDLAREIRMDGDWLSQIIIITNYEQYKNINFTGKILMLDFISKNKEIRPYLSEALLVVYNIICGQKSLNFQYNGEIFQVPYNEILYIEKNLNDNYSTIVAVDRKIQIKQTISNLDDFLKSDPRFMKTHRSCIVNLSNVRSIDLKNSIIKFKNTQTDLLSRSKKQEIKDRMIHKEKIES